MVGDTRQVDEIQSNCQVRKCRRIIPADDAEYLLLCSASPNGWPELIHFWHSKCLAKRGKEKRTFIIQRATILYLPVPGVDWLPNFTGEIQTV